MRIGDYVVGLIIVVLYTTICIMLYHVGYEKGKKGNHFELRSLDVCVNKEWQTFKFKDHSVLGTGQYWWQFDGKNMEVVLLKEIARATAKVEK